MAKTDRHFEILLEVLASPKQEITLEEFKKFTNPEQEKMRQRDLKDLTEKPLYADEPILKKTDDGKKLYLNKKIFRYSPPEHLESFFLLEACRKVGHLFEIEAFKNEIKELQNDTFNGKNDQMRRKFYYLSKITSKHGPNFSETLSSCICSLIENKEISFKYSGYEYDKIFPLSLIQYRDALYLMAAKDRLDKDRLRTFKLDRIESIKLNTSEFTYPRADFWDPEKYFENSSGLIRGEDKEAIIRVYGNSRIHFKEKTIFNNEMIESSEEYDEYKLSYSGQDEFLGQLFVYAQDIKIINSDDLRTAFLKKAREALIKNSEDE